MELETIDIFGLKYLTWARFVIPFNYDANCLATRIPFAFFFFEKNENSHLNDAKIAILVCPLHCFLL